MIDIPDKPFAATRKGWTLWRINAKKKYPIRYFLRYRLWRGLRRAWHRFVHEPWYWLKCRVWHRYNVIVCRKLGPTWVDRDHLILHAAFQCLVDYVKYEDPEVATQTWQQVYDNYREVSDYPEVCKPFASKRADDLMKIKDLYHWYMNLDPYDNDDDDENLTAKLHELVDLRGYLWT